MSVVQICNISGTQTNAQHRAFRADVEGYSHHSKDDGEEIKFRYPPFRFAVGHDGKLGSFSFGVGTSRDARKILRNIAFQLAVEYRKDSGQQLHTDADGLTYTATYANDPEGFTENRVFENTVHRHTSQPGVAVKTSREGSTSASFDDSSLALVESSEKITVHDVALSLSLSLTHIHTYTHTHTHTHTHTLTHIRMYVHQLRLDDANSDADVHILSKTTLQRTSKTVTTLSDEDSEYCLDQSENESKQDTYQDAYPFTKVKKKKSKGGHLSAIQPKKGRKNPKAFGSESYRPRKQHHSSSSQKQQQQMRTRMSANQKEFTNFVRHSRQWTMKNSGGEPKLNLVNLISEIKRYFGFVVGFKHLMLSVSSQNSDFYNKLAYQMEVLH